MTIADVVGWKWSNQPGMVCKVIDGTVQLVQFPGGIPSQSLQDQWTAEYQTWLASTGPLDQECTDTIVADKMRKLIFEMNFDQENRMRVLEGKPTITRTQYRTALFGVWRTL